MSKMYSAPGPQSGQTHLAIANQSGVGLTLLGIAYLMFVIYGSLVPLDFRPMSLEAATQAFKTIPYLSLGIESRADWVANLLLFIPLAFLWCGALWSRGSAGLKLIAALSVALACVALSFAIEFTQLFFPQRTVSINDIAAESLGGAIGVLLWWQMGTRFRLWLGSLKLASGTSGVAQRLVMAYLLVLLGYNLMPLDLTLSPVELYHKWNEGRILIIPFSARYDDTAHRIYDLLSDVAIWVPAALLWKIAYRQPGATAWMYVVATATALEVLQLFVYSRVSDITDVITAAIGCSIAMALSRGHRGQHARAQHANHRTAAAGWTQIGFAVLIWLTVLATVFWYPFDFNFDRSFVRDRLLILKQVPFQAYYFGSEFRAITEVLHKTGFMLPLGVLLAWLGNTATRTPRGWVHTVMICVVGFVALGIEFGQIFLAGKNADITDVALEFGGGILGYWGFIFTVGRASQSHERPPS